jgi:hypothetical protein
MARFGTFIYGGERLPSGDRLPTREECGAMVAEFAARKGITKLDAAWATNGGGPRDEVADVLRGRGS